MDERSVEVFRKSGKDVSYKKIVVSSRGDKTDVACVVANCEVRPSTTVRTETKKFLGITIECTETTEYGEDLHVKEAGYMRASFENSAIVPFERKF